MNSISLSFDSPEANLACDEVLLDLCEAEHADEVLRFWEPAQPFVVLGYANRVAREVNLPFCRHRGIPVLRRCTGGGTVLQSPGCLNYSLILRINRAPELQNITSTNAYILHRHQAALSTLLGHPVQLQGHTDLAIDGLKFCGNAQRRKRHCLIFHGCFLLDADINLIEQALPMPSQQPTYRANRPHAAFLRDLHIPASDLQTALVQAWNATQPSTDLPLARIVALARDKYATPEWNLKF